MDKWEELESNNFKGFNGDFLKLGGELLEVRSSLVHKKGVFALKKIPQNKIFYTVPVNDLKSSPSSNFIRISKGVFVNDPLVLNFINHSCSPNSKLTITQKGVFLESIRVINVGEEITIDYNLTEEMGELVECNCKSTNCRHFFYIT